MDNIDRKILSLLQSDASLSISEIASQVNLSSTPCWKRIRRLEDEGIIRKRVALLDSDKIGGGIMVFISIKTNEHNQDWFNQFVATVDEMSEVMGFYRLAGDVDYLMKVVVPDIASYNDFYLRLIDRLPLSNVTAGFVMEQIKDTTELPLPH
ncbi:MAG TPA: Lrp/AsnC family transcriptional regulator [Gammaproteobacteria bacterium]|jgi:Lrp/AsnC family transcriptional regulator|nr:Lrp/AsnC family transcriptional regulator [Gammaproteobacteria bacterium]HIB07691.1 Lrp/AsnC family transcriptional regulator [Gammaproteobacteria bacterium]HIB80437.1 Lrp/AsnC family transcriptional regulator [Gammaproteobacteria bacterium]HIO17929.1 Lrp/AsnC family transcriptional regulator [Gammaproteobacteria bacterium]